MNVKVESLKLYKAKLPQVLPFAMLYGFFVLLVLALGYFFSPSLILTVPFVLLPSTFALQVSVAHINNNFPNVFKVFFVGYGLYFSRKGFGCYRSLGGFLKALGVFVAIEGVLEVIFLYTFMRHDSSLADIVNNLSLENYLQSAEALMANETFIKGIKISTIAAMGLAFYMFAHHVFSHGFKANLVMYNANTAVIMPMLNDMHRQFFRIIRKEYYKDYYSSLWFVIPLYVLTYAGGGILAYFILEDQDFMQCQIMALAISLVAMLVLLPYICNVMESLYKKYAPRYNELGLKSVQESFEELMKSKDLSDEQKRALQEIADKAKEKQQTEEKDQE